MFVRWCYKLLVNIKTIEIILIIKAASSRDWWTLLFVKLLNLRGIGIRIGQVKSLTILSLLELIFKVIYLIWSSLIIVIAVQNIWLTGLVNRKFVRVNKMGVILDRNIVLLSLQSLPISSHKLLVFGALIWRWLITERHIGIAVIFQRN